GNGAEAVDVIGRPLAGAVAEAILRAADDVVDARGAIPRDADVPFHIGVVREKLTVAIEGSIELVAESCSDQLPGLALWIGPSDPALRSQRVVHEAGGNARNKVVLTPDQRDAGRIELSRLRVVAAHDKNRFAVGRRNERMDAVLAAAIDAAKKLHVVETVVAV